MDDLLIGIDAGHSFAAQAQPAGNGEFGVLKVSAVTWGKFNPEENKALFPGTEINEVFTVKADDILITRANTAELVGAVVLVERDHPNLLLSDKTLRLVFIQNTILPALHDLCVAFRLGSQLFCTERKRDQQFDAQSVSGQDAWAPIALPPLAEQHRIVAKVDQLMRQCDTLEAGLARAEGQRRALTAAALHGAFGWLRPSSVMLSGLTESGFVTVIPQRS